jgi:hypothetical protein
MRVPSLQFDRRLVRCDIGKVYTYNYYVHELLFDSSFVLLCGPKSPNKSLMFMSMTIRHSISCSPLKWHETHSLGYSSLIVKYKRNAETNHNNIINASMEIQKPASVANQATYNDRRSVLRNLTVIVLKSPFFLPQVEITTVVQGTLWPLRSTRLDKTQQINVADTGL